MNRLTIKLNLSILTGTSALLLSSGVALGAETITFGIFNDQNSQERQWAEEKAKSFEAETGIKVDVQFYPDWRDKATTMIATGSMPDVASLSPETFFVPAENGAFLDLRHFMQQDTELRKETLAPVAWEGYTLPNGTIWGVPQYLWVVLMSYNKAFVSNSGLADPNTLSAQAWNWDLFREYAQKLTVDANGDGTPERWGVNIPPSINRWGNLLVQAGGNWTDRTMDPTRITIDTPAAKIGLEYLNSLYRGGWATTGYSSPWLKGQTVFNWNGAPNLPVTVRKNGFSWDWDYVRQPMGPVGNGSEVTSQGYVIPSTTKDVKAAWAWIKYLVVDHAVDWTRDTGRPTSVLKDIHQYVSTVDGAAPNQGFVIDALLNPNSYYRPVLRDPRAQSVVEETLAKAFAGEIPLQQAIDEASRVANAILADAHTK